MESLTAAERETTWTGTDADDHVVIESTQRTRITELRKAFPEYEVGAGKHGSTEWARFRVPVNEVRIARRRRMNLSTEQREAIGARLAGSRP